MLPRIIFCTAVLVAILTVVLLALFSPVTHSNPAKNPTRPWLSLSLYIQQPQPPVNSSTPPAVRSSPGVLVFHRKLTEGPENFSRVVGKAQGFIIPMEHFAHSGFNVIYLTFDTHKYSGSLTIEAQNFSHKDGGELTVVGGTGSFAFARGHAVFSQTENQAYPATYHIRLHLKFPKPTQTLRG